MIKVREWIFRIRNYERLFRDLSRTVDRCNELYIENQGLKLNQWSLPNPSIIYYSAPKRRRLTSYVKERKILDVVTIATEILDVVTDWYNCDSVVLACQEWLDYQFKKKRFLYKKEKGEKWRTPEETLKLGSGDCDDYMLLLYFVIRQALKLTGDWVHYSDRLYCVVGNVNHPGYPDPKELHAYLLWRSIDTNQFYTIETTYYRHKAIGNFLKLPAKRNSMYGMLRWMFNEQYSYRVNSLWFN